MQVSVIPFNLVSAASANSRRSADVGAERAAGRLAKAKEALQTLEQVRKSAVEGDAMKRAAREKVAQLKERLKYLRMFGGTPQQIAQLARELAQAVKAYAGAGGSGADVGGSGSQSGAAATEDAGLQSPGAPVATDPALAAPTETHGEAKVEDVDPNSGQPKSTDGSAPQNPYQEALQAREQEDGRRGRTEGGDDADREFMNAAKLLAKQLKQIARDVAHKAQSATNDRDAANASEAANAAEKAVLEAEMQMQSSGLAIVV